MSQYPERQRRASGRQPAARYPERERGAGPGADACGTAPLAYLITFRTYGTWLHGDQRGSVDREHNQYGTPFLPPDARREQYERAMARHEAFVLGAAERSAVREAILEVAGFRQWTVHELAVRSNHVHMVVSAPCDPDPVMGAFKAWATRRLRERGLVRPDRRLWSAGGSRKYLWKPHELRAACGYVLDGQGADL